MHKYRVSCDPGMITAWQKRKSAELALKWSSIPTILLLLQKRKQPKTKGTDTIFIEKTQKQPILLLLTILQQKSPACQTKQHAALPAGAAEPSEGLVASTTSLAPLLEE